MNILLKSLPLFLSVLSLPALASSPTNTLSVINQGKVVTTVVIPLSVDVKLSAEQQQANADGTLSTFKGKAEAVLMLPSGEAIRVQADELQLTTKAAQP